MIAGGGFAMMAWKLAQLRALGSFGTEGARPDVCPCKGCDEYRSIVKDAYCAQFDYSNRGKVERRWDGGRWAL